MLCPSSRVGQSSGESFRPSEDVAALLRRLLPEAPVPHAGMSSAALSELLQAVAGKKVALERDLRGLKNVLSWLHRYERRVQSQDLTSLFGASDEMVVEQAVELPAHSAPTPAEGQMLLSGGGDGHGSASPGTAASCSASSAVGAPDAAVVVPAAACGRRPEGDAAPCPVVPPVACRGAGAARSRSAPRAVSRRSAGAARSESSAVEASIKKQCPADKCWACFNEERGVARSWAHTRGARGRKCRLQPKGSGRGAGFASLPSRSSSGRASAPASISPASSSSSSSEAAE